MAALMVLQMAVSMVVLTDCLKAARMDFVTAGYLVEN
jgi:hypothetical protein